MEIVNFEIVAGSAPLLRFKLKDPENVLNWTTTLYLKDKTGAVVFSANGALSGDFADAVDRGIWDVPLTVVQTESFVDGMKPSTSRTFQHSFWRTNTGFEDPLSSGTLTVKKV